MTVKATFDSNVWRKVASPEKFANNPNIATFKAIHSSCKAGEIIGYLSETTFTLEQIKRTERLKWLLESQQITITESNPAPNVIQITVSIGHSDGIKPAEVQMVKDHLEDAYELGIRLLRSKRFLGPSSPLLNDEKYFVKYSSDDEYHKQNNKNGEVSRALEAMGCGIRNLKSLGKANRENNTQNWLTGLSNLENSDQDKVPEFVAE